MKTLRSFQVNFAMYFDQLFADTDIDKLPDDQRIIVREPKYFEQLNAVLVEDQTFTKEGLGSIYNWSYFLPLRYYMIDSPLAMLIFGIYISANYMFLRITISLASQGPKQLEDIAFQFESKISGASYRPPR